jgi:hypothetical protein
LPVICRVLLFVTILSVAGCSKPPAAPASHQTAKEESTPDWRESARATVIPELPLPQITAAPQDHPALGFQNETANQAWNQYVEDFQAIKSMPPPQVQDPVNNPVSVTGYLNQLGNRLKTLQQSRDTVETNLASPEEKKRFRAAEKSLLEAQDQ